MPEHLQLTETNNPGALKWLKKTDKIGMPRAIKSVVKALAALRGSTSERISRSIHMNFSRSSTMIRGFTKSVIYSSLHVSRSQRLHGKIYPSFFIKDPVLACEKL